MVCQYENHLHLLDKIILTSRSMGNFALIFSSITRLPLGNGSIVFAQNFRCGVFTGFICFEVP